VITKDDLQELMTAQEDRLHDTLRNIKPPKAKSTLAIVASTLGIIASLALIIGYLLMPRAEATPIHNGLRTDVDTVTEKVQSQEGKLEKVLHNQIRIGERLKVKGLEGNGE